MKELYHICFTSHGEVMFRDREDHDTFTNYLALRAFETESEIYADAEMSTHAHLIALTECPMRLASIQRMSYTKHFNHKYGRTGRFGEKYTFVKKINGFNHSVTAINYVLRNGLHHGAAPTAFGYEYCSTNDVFAAELGVNQSCELLKDRRDIAARLPKNVVFPDHYRMNRDGRILRGSFLQIRKVEHFYSTPRNFLFQMNRLTDESWSEEQQRDATEAPIKLNDIEPFASKHDIASMLNHEYGRDYRVTRLQDLDVCRIIDKEILRGSKSMYAISESQKKKIADVLKYDFHLPEAQILRCLAL